jgi:hypothetical protein
VDDNGTEPVTLSESGSFDSDGSITSFEWREGTTLLGSGPTVDVSFIVGTHTVTLTGTDNAAATSSDTVVISVNAAASNQPPIANAGLDQTVTDSDGNGVETILLNGSGSADADGTISIYQWREGTTILGTGVTLNATFSSGASHTVLLTVTDNAGATGTDTVVVNVNDVAATPQGTVSVSGTTSIDRGDNTSFTVSLTNTGSSTLTGVQLSFNVSPSDMLRNLSPGNSVNVGDVAPGGSVSQTWAARADNEGSGSVTASASSNGTSLDSASQALTVVK